MARSGGAGSDRGLVVFSLMHAGYLRHYGEPIRLLAERGYRVRIAVGQPDKHPDDTALLERVVSSAPGIDASYSLDRSSFDGWRRLAWIVRGLTDLARYALPHYAHAHALRERMRAKVVDRILGSTMDPVSKRLTAALAHRIDAAESITAVARNLSLLALAEAAIPPSRRHLDLLRRLDPVAVFASPVVEVASPQVEFVKAARALGVPTGVCIASWDNLTNKGMIRVVPDRVIVWNEAQRREAAELQGIDPKTVITTGAQKFDAWFEREPSTTREEFAAAAGVRADGPLVLYLGSSPFIAPDEVSFVERWLAAVRAAGGELGSAGVVIRPHPQNGAQWRGWSAPEGVSVWPPEGAQPDAGDARAGFFDSIWHATLVVGVNTSALIESGIAGKGVYTVLDPQFAGTQEGTLHFRHLLREHGGFLQVARTLDEHVEQLRAGLGGADAEAERTRSFMASFVRPHGLDLPAAPLVADALEAVAGLGPRPPFQPSARARALRLALLPLVLANAAVAFVAGAGGRRLRRLSA